MKTVFAENLISLRHYLSVLTKEKWTQTRMGELIRVHQKTIALWERGGGFPENALTRVADGLERLFSREGLRVSAEEVGEAGLVGKIRARLEDSVAGDSGEGTRYSLRQLRKLLDDERNRAILGIDGSLEAWLLSKVGEYRPDLTDQDWAEVIRKLRAGTFAEDEWMYKDPQVVTARLHFKSPRPLTDQEIRKAQKIAQAALNEIWEIEKRTEAQELRGNQGEPDE